MVLLIIGVNGVGKTTTIGKLASRFKIVGRRVIICAARHLPRRRRRAADRLGRARGRAHRQAEGGRGPRRRGVTTAFRPPRADMPDMLIVDTAGRLHNKAHLMEELKKIGARGRSASIPRPSVKALLVIDATTGQNGLAQAKVFKDVADIDGIVLTKLDGTAKGGIAIAIRQRTGPARALHRPGRAARRHAALRREGVHRRDFLRQFYRFRRAGSSSPALFFCAAKST